MLLNEILEKGIRLVVASKYANIDQIQHLYNQGLLEYGENKIQDLNSKQNALKHLNIKWHFIGNLQKNKINLLIKQRPILWQSCNSLELAKEVDKRLDYVLPTLLEVNFAGEKSKNGIDKDLAFDSFLQIQKECSNINLCGIMSIGSHSNDNKKIIKSFEECYKLFDKLKNHGAKICSMGMSDDYELAIKCGSNMIRLGRILFYDKQS